MPNVDPRNIAQLRDLVFCDVGPGERKLYGADDAVEVAIDAITALRAHRDRLEERVAVLAAANTALVDATDKVYELVTPVIEALFKAVEGDAKRTRQLDEMKAQVADVRAQLRKLVQ